MREIKFRAWDGKRMTTSGIMFNNTTSCLEVPTGSQMKLMQYTGLKDKNGKEIYVGDICQITMRHKYGHSEDNKKAIVGCVEFGRISIKDNSLYAFNCFHINNRSIEYLLGNELEVIGNIYENPELLNNAL